MQVHNPVPNPNKLTITPQSSHKTIQTRSVTPLTSTRNPTSETKRPRIPIQISYKKPSTPILRHDPPFVMMRNGMTFLYTPGQSDMHPNLFAPFGTSLKGFKIRGRPERGNMFAVHTEDRLSPNLFLQPRSYLSMRSKWK